MNELEILERAHRLFGDVVTPPQLGADPLSTRLDEPRSGQPPAGYLRQTQLQGAELRQAAHTDAQVRVILAAAHQDHSEAREATGRIVAAARNDQVTQYDSPIAQREALRRRIARLRAQRRYVLLARARARRRARLLRALRYRSRRRGRRIVEPGSAPGGVGATAAVRAAMSRLGRPYVWGATGPDSFDCSGLMQWAYRQAGVELPRTTYDQINAGIPVSRADVRPGDLVFPHTGHVQMAVGNGMVIESPTPGQSVKLSPLGPAIAIRRVG